MIIVAAKIPYYTLVACHLSACEVRELTEPGWTAETMFGFSELGPGLGSSP